MSPEKTYQILRRTKQGEAADVLSFGIAKGDVATRDRCIETLAYRKDAASHRVLCRLWPEHREAIIVQLGTQSSDRVPWFGSVTERLDDPATSDTDLRTAVDIASNFRLTDALPRLIDLARNHENLELRQMVLEVIVSLSQHWGTLARNNYAGMNPLPSLERKRLGVMDQFQAAVREFQNHRCEKFIDAMLMLATWNDPVLQSIIKEDTPCRKVVLRRMRSSKLRGAVILLAGFLRRRTIPESVIGVMWQRSDVVFREFLLRAISATPDRTIIKHLQEYGLPECLRGGTELVHQIDPVHDASLAHAYSAAMGRNPETLLVILELIERQMTVGDLSHTPPNERTLVAFAQSLHRCERPSIEFWLHAMASPVMDREADTPPTLLDSQSDLAARICSRLVALVLQDESPLDQVAAELLCELSIQQALPQFRELSPVQRLRLGRTLIQIDGQTIEVIQDGLRHAVMQRRLEAIEFAKTLGLIDLMIEPLAMIARGDHQIARMAATEALADAQGETSADLLRQLCHSEQPSLSDAARVALQMRGFTA